MATLERVRKSAYYDALGDIVEAMKAIDQAKSMVVPGSVTYKILRQAHDDLEDIDFGDIDFDLRETR